MSDLQTSSPVRNVPSPAPTSVREGSPRDARLGAVVEAAYLLQAVRR